MCVCLIPEELPTSKKSYRTDFRPSSYFALTKPTKHAKPDHACDPPSKLPMRPWLHQTRPAPCNQSGTERAPNSTTPTMKWGKPRTHHIWIENRLDWFDTPFFEQNTCIKLKDTVQVHIQVHSGRIQWHSWALGGFWAVTHCLAPRRD
jgi:hypothetical protein